MPPSYVAEITRTVGLGPYVTDRALPRHARIADIYAIGELFDYFCDDNGGKAEHGSGSLDNQYRVLRLQIIWSTSGGVGGSPIDWGPGKRTITAYPSSGGPSVTTLIISGFWTGTVSSLEKIERYVFAQTARLDAGMPESIATADTPNTGTLGGSFVDENGDLFIDELGNDFADGLAGTAAEFSIQKNSVEIGTMIFEAGVTTAHFTMAASVTFARGDIFEIVGPVSVGAIADIMWNISLVAL